jgi:dienelactone hydrolase
VHPASGKHPGVLVWPDIFGLRPAFKDMGKRLAGLGYPVLVVISSIARRSHRSLPRVRASRIQMFALRS